MLFFLYLIITATISIGFTWYFINNKWRMQYGQLQLHLENQKVRYQETMNTLAEAQKANVVLNAEVASLETQNKHLQEKLYTEQQSIGKLEEKLTLQFKNLANDLLEEKSKKFTDQNRYNIEALLKPLAERIQSFEQKVIQTNKEGLERTVALRTEINRLYVLNTQMSKEAENLAKAIKGETKTQGNWGEMILERILETSGLAKDREYILQNSFVSQEDGKRYQPDAIIKLPAERHLIIDAKVSLLHYEKFYNAEETTEKEMQLKNHLLSVRRHIKMLGEKNYQTHCAINGLDFVLLFMPIESAFSLVIQNDHSIFKEAYEKNIIIVSPATLMATLRTIANIWQQESQNQNALEIAQQSGALYDKFVAFITDLKNLGKQLDTTQKTYEEAVKKLYEGKGNLVRRAEKIRLLGAKTTKIIDSQKLADIDD